MKTRNILNLISLSTLIPVLAIYSVRTLLGVKQFYPTVDGPMIILVLIGTTLMGITFLWRGEFPLFLWEIRGLAVRMLGLAVLLISLSSIIRIAIAIVGSGDLDSY